MNKMAKLIIIALPMHVLFCGCWEYFFEDLPRELEIERWELLHPDQPRFYQTNPMHTLVDNISCNFLYGGQCNFIDAAWIQRRFFFHKGSATTTTLSQ